jgi:hypothetical protein
VTSPVRVTPGARAAVTLAGATRFDVRGTGSAAIVEATATGLVGALRPISLEEIEARASLQRRVDRKSVIAWRTFEALVERLAADHDVLEIDGRRIFGYSSVYFDTPDMRCYHDHVESRAPRFKARTRHYEDTGVCHFEVKLKLPDGETDKRQIDHAAERADDLTPEARRLLAETLPPAGLAAPDDLDPILRTRFRRITLAARDTPARLTCDVDVAMERLDGASARIRDHMVLVESKSEDGRAAADRVLAEMGEETVSLSKYRTGIDLLVQRDDSPDAAAIRALFDAPGQASPARR